MILPLLLAKSFLESITMTTQLGNLSSRLLHKAAAIQEQIEELKEKLRAVLEDKQVTLSLTASVGAGARRMSLAARRRIAAAQKERWAKHRAAAGKNSNRSNHVPKMAAKRHISAAGRAKIAAAAKRRWARAKSEGKNAL